MRRMLAASALALFGLVAATTANAGSNGAWQLRTTAKSSTRTHALTRSTAGAATGVFQTRRATTRPAAPAAPAILSTWEADLLRRINAQRAARGLRAFRLSRGLSAAAAYHSNQMGLRGFFEHESANGTPFWKRIERFYPMLSGRSWSVGENIVFGTPDISPQGALREWMTSPPHRANLLSREWREIGLGMAHFPSAPGEFRGGPVTVVTADFGARA